MNNANKGTCLNDSDMTKKNDTIEMSFDEYDTFVDNINDMKFRAGDWTPTIFDINKYMEKAKNKKLFFSFLIWILETHSIDDCDSCKDQKEKEFKNVENYINSVLRQKLVLY